MTHPVYTDISADGMIDAARLGPNGEVVHEDGSLPATPELEDELEVFNLRWTHRKVGLLQTKPKDEQQAVYHELAAKYLPKLAEAYRKRRTPNNAPQCLINCVAYTPYFVRFSKTPAGAGLPRLQAERMARYDLIESQGHHETVAELCQFLSTLIVVYSVDTDFISDDDTKQLLTKLKAWRQQYRGRFAGETTSRCIDMLEPHTETGKDMTMMMLMMRLTLELGVDMCAIKGCKECKDEKDLLQCSKCKTVRYCGREHQKLDWRKHKTNCYSPSF